MRARYDGVCIKCTLPISGWESSPTVPTSDIGWSRKPRRDGLRSVAWHTECANKEDNADLVAALLEKQRNEKNQTVSATVPTFTVPPSHETGESMHTENQDNFLAGMAQALVPYLTGKVGANLDEIKQKVSDALADFSKKTGTALDSLKPQLESMIASATRNVTVTNDRTKEVKAVGRQHIRFPELLTLCSVGEDVYLHGEPGTGKTSAGAKVAEALSLPFGYISLTVQTAESRLIGYKDAHGNYVETEFFKRYVNGGVFLIDEIDNASGNLLTALNSALANGKGAFPCGQVERHEDFICIATGNTTGFGHNPMFPERQVLSGAIRDRFAFMEWTYDNDFELDLALSQNENSANVTKWVKWVHAVREYARKNDPKLPVTPRASIKGAKMLGKFPVATLADMLVFRGYDKDSVKRILQANPLPSI